MKLYKKILILIGLLALLIYFNWSVLQKENTLKDGTLVLLELAPVDPRSLIQGDYMRLRYSISTIRENDIFVPENTLKKFESDVEKMKSGYCVLTLDSNHVGHKVYLQKDFPELKLGEIVIKYKRHRSQSIQLGAESYFFEEGKAGLFENAKYGGLRVDRKGNSILIGLYDENFRLIQ